MLEGKEALAIERVFRVLQLMFPRERVEHVYLGFRSSRPDLRAAAQELLFELLRSPWRESVLAVLNSDEVGEEPVRAPWSQSELERPETFVTALLGHSSELVRVLAAYLATERGWLEAIPGLRAASETMEPENRTLLSEAISLLERSERRRHG
jgi:HEAT repeat protein